MHRQPRLRRQSSSTRAPSPPIVHNTVFRVSLDRRSTDQLVKWVADAAVQVDCPAGFQFPAVRAKIPNAWIDANAAMDGVKAKQPAKPFIMWREAVESFRYFMEAKRTPLADPGDVLLRAMQHREAEGGVLLSLEDSSAPAGGSAGMIQLDPVWLIELVRRLTDHNLVDDANEYDLKEALEEYGQGHSPRLELADLWTQHK